jgi:hypothetical protein
LRTASRSTWLLGVALALGSGCGSGGDEATISDGGVTPTGAATCEQAAAPYCHKLFECEPASGEEVYGTVQSCLATEAADCRYLAELPGVSSQAIQTWAACDRAVGARTCDQWRFAGAEPACRFQPGMRKPGEGCSAFAQCATNYCQHDYNPSTGAISECGICAQAPGVGEECNEGNGCDFGLRCTATREHPLACVQTLAEGGACHEELDECRGQLVCVDGRCSKPLRKGAACIGAWQCEGILRCVEGTCVDPLPGGAACDPDEEDCAAGLGCYNGICSRLLPDGSPCADHAQCLGGFCGGVCEGAEPSAGTGEPCAPDVASTGIGPECNYNAFCDKATSRCVLRKPPGQPCVDSEQCLGWLVCSAGKCDEPPAPMCGG